MFKSSKLKKLASVITAIMLVVSFVMPVSAFAEGAESDTVTLTVIGTSDIHGAITSWSYENDKDYGNVGLARISTIVKQVKNENPNTLLIDNGDSIQGSILTDDLFNTNLEEKNPMIDVMNFIGYDSMTLGNHEFNFGTNVIDKMVKEANFPILSANVYNEDGTNFVKPYVIKEVAGIKIGILGLTVPSIPRWDGPRVEGLKFEHMAHEAAKYVKILKDEEKVDLIIATAHAGLDTRHETDGSDAARNICMEAPEISVLLTGHDHSTVNETINDVLVAAPAAKYGQATEVVRFDITLQKDGDTWSVVDKKAQILNIADYDSDALVEEHASYYHEKTMKLLENTIGTATEDFHPAAEIKGIPEAQIRDTAVIDLINEVQLKNTGADVAAAALFKSSSNLPKGDLNYANVFDIYKYANKLVGVEVTGKELKNYMEWSASYFNTFKEGDLTISFNPEIRGYNYDMFAGVDYKIDISKPAGERIVDLTLNGKPISDDQKIKLAVNDYRYSGLKNMGIISEDYYINTDPTTLRSYIKDYIEEKGTIEPKADNNWEIIGYNWDEELRNEAVKLVNDGTLEIPTSEDGRTSNVKAITVEDIAEVSETYDVLTIAHTNDTHGRVKAGKYDGMGLAKISTEINKIRENNTNVLVLDAGDTFHGQTIINLGKGKGIVDIMNTIGYDAMTAGNHDFNYGQERLLELAEEANFPVLAANVLKEDGTALLNSYVIKNCGDIKVGIFGLATPETIFKTHPNNVKGLTFEDPSKAAAEMVEKLKAENCDLIVALAHLGLDEDSTYTSEKVAKEVTGIDLIVDGHSHTVLENGKEVNGTFIVQTGEYDKNLGKTYVIFKDGKLNDIKASLISKEEATNTTEDPEILKVIEELEAENEKITSVVVGSTDVILDGEREDVRTHETNLGDLIADAMIDATGADAALTNGGGIRASINAGEITKGEIITVLPFGNYVVMKEVKGSDIISAIEHGIESYPKTKGAFPHVGKIEFKFDPSKEAGNRLIEATIGGEKIDSEKMYKLATNDFLAVGGDGYEMFKGAETLGEYPGLDEVVINYINKYGVKEASADGRVQVVEVKNAYVVKLGDTLGNIAAKYNVSVKEIAEASEISNPALIFPGDKLVIPGATVEESDNTYTVEAGDTLGSIGQQYGVDYEDLAKYNNIEDANLIFVNQKILIPVK